MLTVRPFGTTAATPRRPATDVELVEIASDSLVVRVLTLGGAIHSVDTPDRDGRSGPVHLTLADLAQYADPGRNPHLGSSIGRFANRIAGARFPLVGGEVDLVANDGPNTLHGGPWGWDRHVWDLLDADGADHGGTALFRLVSPDGDEGFPGTATATACFEVEGDVLRITYGATTDAPTVVNMTNHGYWNLDGAPTVADHHLALAADRVLPVDATGIPVGGLEPVDGTPFDLRSRTQLGPAISAVGPGFDQCFEVRGPGGTVRPAAVLDAPASGRWMSVRTDQVGVQLYTGNGLGDPFRTHGSVSLETQAYPDTPNRPELGSTLLVPGDHYENVTELRFGAGAPPSLDQLDAP